MKSHAEDRPWSNAMSDDVQSEALLVAGLRAGRWARGEPASPCVVQHAPSLPAAEVEAALRIATRFHVDALVAEGLQRQGVAPELLALAQRRRQASLRSLAVEAARRRALAALEQAGVFAVLMKGALSDALWWRGTGLRGTTDLDILIPREDEATAHRALEAMGYRRAVAPDRAFSAFRQRARLYLAADARQRNTLLDVDLHVGVMKSPPYVECASELLGRAVEYPTAQGRVRGLAKEDMLAHIAGNLAANKFMERFKLMLDAADLCEDPAVDLGVVVERAERWGCAWGLWGIFRWCAVHFHVSIPPEVVRAVAPDAARRALVEKVVGVYGPPWVPASGVGRTVLVEWPLLGRPLWPLEAGGRHLALRAADEALFRWRRLRARQRPSRGGPG